MMMPSVRYKYDFTVIFNTVSENDSKFAETFVEQIETKYGKKGFLRGRNFVPGLKPDILEYVLHNCERVFIVYSQDTNEQVNYEGNMALEKYLEEDKPENRERIIPLVSDSKGRVPPFLRCYNKIEYLKNGTENKYFWDNIQSVVSSPIGTSLPGRDCHALTKSVTLNAEQPMSVAYDAGNGQEQPMRPALYEVGNGQENIPFADSDSGFQTSPDAAMAIEEANTDRRRTPDLTASGRGEREDEDNTSDGDRRKNESKRNPPQVVHKTVENQALTSGRREEIMCGASEGDRSTENREPPDEPCRSTNGDQPKVGTDVVVQLEEKKDEQQVPDNNHHCCPKCSIL
ncbi:uncharacterized protein LOC144435779 [Glandiceps talaboti]